MKRLLAIFSLIAAQLALLASPTMPWLKNARGPSGGGGGGGPTLVASVKGQSPDGNAFTTASIDTTGANLIVISIAASDSSNPQVSDNKSNTFAPLTSSAVGNAQNRLFYVYAPAVGTGHTFSAQTGYASIQVVAFSGVATSPLDQQAGATNSNWTTIQLGSITPSQANTLSIVGLCFEESTSSISINDGYTIAQTSQGAPAAAVADSSGGGWTQIQQAGNNPHAVSNLSGNTFDVNSSDGQNELPAQGSAITMVASIYGWQQQDTGVSATLLRKANYYHGTAEIPTGEALGSDTLAASWFRSEKPSYFGNLAWPAYDSGTPAASKTAIPAGYRYVNGNENYLSSGSGGVQVTNFSVGTFNVP